MRDGADAPAWRMRKVGVGVDAEDAPPGCDDAREVLAFPQKLRIKRLSPEAAETLQ